MDGPAAMTFGIGLMPEYPPDEYARLVRLAEEHGFTNIWVPDQKFYRECYPYMALAAFHTTRVKLGTCVTDPFTRHPALTAAAMATVDELAQGRGILGIGAGASGMGALKIKREKPATALREALQVIRGLWRGESVTVDGEVIRFRSGRLDFRPRPDIPIYLAGRGPQILQLAGEIADGAIIGALASPPTLSYAMRHIEAGRRRAGRTEAQEVAIWLHTAISGDKARAQDAVRRVVVSILVTSATVLDSLGVSLSDELRASIGRIPYGTPQADISEALRLLTPDVLEHFSMAGDEEFCRHKVRALADGGVNHVAVVPWLTPGQTIEQFITQFAGAVIAGHR